MTIQISVKREPGQIVWTYLLSGLIVWFCSWLLLFTHASIPPAVAGTVVAQVNVHTCTHEHTCGPVRPGPACKAWPGPTQHVLQVVLVMVSSGQLSSILLQLPTGTTLVYLSTAISLSLFQQLVQLVCAHESAHSTHARAHACTHARMHVRTYAHTLICTHTCTHTCT